MDNSKSNIKKLSNIIEEILNDFNDDEYLVNPYFRIPKLTSEETKKYKFLLGKYPRETAIIFGLVSFPFHLFILATMSIMSLLLFYQHLIFQPKTKNLEFLFLSHAQKENIIDKKSDQFFALMPEYLKRTGNKVGIIYTNHSRTRYLNKNKLINQKSTGIARQIVPKFLKPHEHIYYLHLINKLSYQAIKKGFKLYSDEPMKSALLISSFVTFYSRSTYNNYLLGQRIEDYCLKTFTKSIFMTFEGKSYEQYVTSRLQTNIPTLRIIFYQHSPIVFDQIGVVNFLRRNHKKIIILTTGRIYKNYFRRISKSPRYYVIGSQKASRKISSKETKQISVLFAPEGTNKATQDFTKLIFNLVKSYPRQKFIIRLHPNLKKSLATEYGLFKLRKYSNFIISKNSLGKDLATSKFVFYRSSAVGIEALKSKSIPVFYSGANQSELDALCFTNDVSVTMESIKDFSKLLTINNKNMYVRRKYFDALFSKLDYRILNKL
jgi:hypothetical protein